MSKNYTLEIRLIGTQPLQPDVQKKFVAETDRPYNISDERPVVLKSQLKKGTKDRNKGRNAARPHLGTVVDNGLGH